MNTLSRPITARTRVDAMKRHESIEYLYVEPVKAVSLEVKKRSMNSPVELVHGIAHNIKPDSQPTKQQCRKTRYTTHAGKYHLTTHTNLINGDGHVSR